jgi:hypothetical protein
MVMILPHPLRLSDLMNDVIAIHGRGNFPTLEVKLGRTSYIHAS